MLRDFEASEFSSIDCFCDLSDVILCLSAKDLTMISWKDRREGYDLNWHRKLLDQPFVITSAAIFGYVSSNAAI